MGSGGAWGERSQGRQEGVGGGGGRVGRVGLKHGTLSDCFEAHPETMKLVTAKCSLQDAKMSVSTTDMTMRHTSDC